MLVKNMNKKTKIKESFVGFIFNSDYEIRIANNTGSAHHQKRFGDQVKNRLYVVKKKVLKRIKYQNYIFEFNKIGKGSYFSILERPTLG